LNYLLWRDIFVAPIVEDSLQRKIEFPDGDDWVYWFNPNLIYPGGTTQTLTFQLNYYPVYQRKGSLIALHVNDDGPYASFCSTLVQNHITAVVHPMVGKTASRVIRRWNNNSTEMYYSWTENTLKFVSTPTINEPLILILQGMDGNFEIYSKVHERKLEFSPKESFLRKQEILPSFYFKKALNQVVIHTGMVSMSSGVHLELLFK